MMMVMMMMMTFYCQDDKNYLCSSKTQKLWESLDDIDVIRSQVPEI